MKKLLTENGLSIVMFSLFAVFLVGQSLAGLRAHNTEQRLHGEDAYTYWRYVSSGEFAESVFENWESEFLQMGAFVLLATRLRQRGSAEAKGPEGDEELDSDPKTRKKPESPGPVHRGGLALALYSHSLSIALFALFLLSFAGHALGGHSFYNDELAQHGQAPVSLLSYLAGARFWFESFQNWQSEFLSVAALVVLSIFLRQHGSPESKPVAAANQENE